VLGQGGVRRRANLRDQRRLGVRADAPPPPGPGRRGHAAGLAPPPPPALDRAPPDAEEAGRLGLGEAGVDGPQQPLAEVGRVLLHRRSLARDQLFRNPL